MADLPAPPVWRKDFYFSALIIVFSVLQVWASFVVFTTYHPSGVATAAFGLLLTGSAAAVVAGWRYIARQNRYRISEPPRRVDVIPDDDPWPSETARTGSTAGFSAERSTHAFRPF